MIVLDASVAVDLLIKPAAETRELRARIRAAGIVYAPHLMDAEVTNAIRKHLLQGRIDQLSARRALRRLAVMRVKLWPHRPFLGRALAVGQHLQHRVLDRVERVVALAQAGFGEAERAPPDAGEEGIQSGYRLAASGARVILALIHAREHRADRFVQSCTAAVHPSCFA